MKLVKTNRFDQKGLRLPKPAKWLVPINLEVKYFKILNQLVRLMIDLTNEQLIPALPSIVNQANQLRPDSIDTIKFDSDDMVRQILLNSSEVTRADLEKQDAKELVLFKSVRLDTPADDIEDIVDSIRIEYARTVTIDTKTGIATDIANQVNAFNGNQFQKVFRSVLAVDVFLAEPWLADEMAFFVKNNVQLITSLSEQYFNQIEQITFQGVRSGQRHEDIAKEIRTRYGVTRNRAKLIGRDQVNKFNGQLTKLRQQEAGVKKYNWITAGDSRVRKKHTAKAESSLHSWNKGIIPGEEIQCRCFAEPIITVGVVRRFKAA